MAEWSRALELLVEHSIMFVCRKRLRYLRQGLGGLTPEAVTVNCFT